MVKLISFLTGVTLFSVLLWENVDQKVTVKILGSRVVENVPVLILILLSFLAGMLLMLPVMWWYLYKQRRRLQTKPQSDTKSEMKSVPDRPAAASGTQHRDAQAADAAALHQTLSSDKQGSSAG